MVHRLHKAIVPHTNKNDIFRDLMTYQNDMQSLRFALQMEMNQGNGGLCELMRLGFFDSAYFESSDELLAWGLDMNINCKTDFISGDKNFIRVICYGHPWTATQISAHPHLSSDVQFAELYKAYESLGFRAILTNNKVTYYTRVSYLVRGNSQSTSMDEENDNNMEIRKVTIKAGDIVEFVDTAIDSFQGRGFGRVIAIMIHEKMVFLVINWIVSTGRQHPRLHLHEFLEAPFFRYAPFQPLTIIDHPRFVNHAHFTRLNGKLYLNEWIFEMV